MPVARRTGRRGRPDAAAPLPPAAAGPRPGCGSVSVFDRMKARWGVGLPGLLAILAAFSLAGTTTVWFKGPVMAFIMPETAPGWLQWAVYLVVMLPVYQVLLLAYGALLGQFDFFWSKLKAVGRLVSGRAPSASG